MKIKLILRFWKNHVLLLALAAILFMLAGICTEYHMMTYWANYYKWQPIKELEGDWYFYVDELSGAQAVETYLKRKGAVEVIEFRREHCPLSDPTDICYDDFYSTGVLWQASAEDVLQVRQKYPEAGSFWSAAEVVEKEDICATPRWWLESVISILVLWGAAMVAGVFWFPRALRVTGEDLNYLVYIGNNKMVLRKLYCNPIVLLGPVVWLLSSMAIFLPDPVTHEVLAGYGYRQIYWQIFLSMLVVSCAMARLLFVLCRRRFETDERLAEMYAEGGMKRIYIGDFTVEENLQLVLMAQGFSSGLATTLARLEMTEHGIAFCAKRPMSMCPGDEKLVFFDLVEEFKEKEPVEI